MKNKYKNEKPTELKDLEWKNKDNDGKMLYAKPSELFWPYYIKTLKDKYELDLFDSEKNSCNYTAEVYKTLDGAKQAAKEHYNQVLKKFNKTKEKP